MLLVAGLAWAGVGAIGGAIATSSAWARPSSRSPYAATPTPAPVGDPRSSGEGPGLVGEPGLAILVVVVIAIAAIVITTLWIRLTDAVDGPPESGAAQPRSRPLKSVRPEPPSRTFVLLARTVHLVGSART